MKRGKAIVKESWWSRPIQRVVPLQDVVVRLPGTYPKARLVSQAAAVKGKSRNGETVFRLNLPCEWEILVAEP